MLVMCKRLLVCIGWDISERKRWRQRTSAFTHFKHVSLGAKPSIDASAARTADGQASVDGHPLTGKMHLAWL